MPPEDELVAEGLIVTVDVPDLHPVAEVVLVIIALIDWKIERVSDANDVRLFIRVDVTVADADTVCVFAATVALLPMPIDGDTDAVIDIDTVIKVVIEEEGEVECEIKVDAERESGAEFDPLLTEVRDPIVLIVACADGLDTNDIDLTLVNDERGESLVKIDEVVVIVPLGDSVAEFVTDVVTVTDAFTLIDVAPDEVDICDTDIILETDTTGESLEMREEEGVIENLTESVAPITVLVTVDD